MQEHVLRMKRLPRLVHKLIIINFRAVTFFFFALYFINSWLKVLYYPISRSCRCSFNMAAQRSQLAKPLHGSISGASPKTPSNTALTETVPLHITPLDPLDSDREPDTPYKVKLMRVLF